MNRLKRGFKAKTKTCGDIPHNPYEISKKASSNLGSAVEQIELRNKINKGGLRSGILKNYIERNKLDSHCAYELLS